MATPNSVVTRRGITPLISAATGTGASTNLFAAIMSQGIDSATMLCQAIPVGVFTALILALQISTDAGTTWSTVATWDAVNNGSYNLFQVSESALYRFNIISFAGGTSITINACMAGTASSQGGSSGSGGLVSEVSASSETSTIFNGTIPLTPTFATIVASASGATTIVAAVASKKIRVIAMELVASAAVNLKWQSHVSPTDISGLSYFAANGGYVLPYNPTGWFQTLAGEALDINLSGAVPVGGALSYVTV